MTITHVGSSTAVMGATSGKKLSLTIPELTEDGDFGVLFVHTFASADRGLPSPLPTGWDLRVNQGGGAWQWRTMLFTAPLNLADAGRMFDVEFFGLTSFTTTLEVFRGVDYADPLDVVGQSKREITDSVTFEGVTTVADGAVLVTSVAAKSPVLAGFSPPATFTELSDNSGADKFRNGATAYKTISTAGAVTPGAVALPEEMDWASVTIAVAPGEPPTEEEVEEDQTGSGFTPIERDSTGVAIDFRNDPSADHLEAIYTGGEYVMAIELLAGITKTPIFSTVAAEDDEAQWWPAVPGGPVGWTKGRTRQRSMRFTIPLDGSDARDAALLPRDTGHPVHPVAGNLIRIWAGHRLESADELLPIATMIVDEAELVDDGSQVLDLSTVDMASLIDVGFGPGGWEVTEGANTVDEVIDVLEVVLPAMSEIIAVTTPYTLPGTQFEEGDSVQTFVVDALASAGLWLVVDQLGVFRIEPVGATWVSTLDPPEWTYGDRGSPVDSVTVRFSIPDTPSGVKMVGATVSEDEDAEPITVTVWDQDPTSLTYWDSTNLAPWAFVAEVTNEFVTTEQQGLIAAWAELRRVGQGGQQVVFTASPNPAIEVDHRVLFGRASAGVAEALWTIVDVQLPIESDSLMQVTIQRSWDPAMENAEIAIPGVPSPSVSTASDDFTYGLDGYGKVGGSGPRKYLYDFPGWGPHTGGSDTVYPMLDRVYGGNGHGFGRWSEQMSSTDHWSEIDIYQIDSDSKGVGPVVRCDRTGPDIRGYQAACVYAGGSRNKVELRRWDSKYDNVVLDTYTHGSTLVGKTVRLAADGGVLTISVDGVDVYEVEDVTHKQGRYVGFVISNAGADSWAAGL